jgi:hypothetical protein
MIKFQAAFYKGTPTKLASKIFDWGVRHLDSGPYSHMELVFSDGMSASSSFADGGVRFKNITFDPTRWDMVDLPAELEAPARAWFVANEGKAYDIMGDLWQMLGFVRDKSDKSFCSAACMNALGFTEPWRFRPNAAKSVCVHFNINTPH